MKSRVDQGNRALLLLLCILLVVRGIVFWPTAQISIQMRWNGFCLSQHLSAFRSATVREQKARRITATEAATLLVLVEDAERNVAAFALKNPFSGSSYDAEHLLELDQTVIHSVCAIKSRGVDRLANAQARTNLATMFGRSETDLKAGVVVLASNLHLLP